MTKRKQFLNDLNEFQIKFNHLTEQLHSHNCIIALHTFHKKKILKKMCLIEKAITDFYAVLKKNNIPTEDLLKDQENEVHEKV